MLTRDRNFFSFVRHQLLTPKNLPLLLFFKERISPVPHNPPLAKGERGGFSFVAPCHQSIPNVDRSPSANPSSRAFSSRRMILPLRGFGTLSRNSIALGATAGPSRGAHGRAALCA